MLAARGQRGFVEDWVGYQPRAGFVADPVRGAIGSYDAIRVYLWHGMLDPRDRALELNGPYDYWRARGQVPEKVDTRHPAAAARPGPVGFLAALLPEIARRGNGEELARLQAQIERARHQRLYGQPPAYYDQNLILFAQGYLESRYHFSRDGRLSSGCGSTATQP
jgi:endoglucanase